MVDTNILMTLSTIFGSGVGLLGAGALLIISLTLVRKANERAGWLLGAGFGVELGLAIVWPLVSFLLPMIGVDSYMTLWPAVSILLNLVRIGGLALQAIGLAQLAQAFIRARETPAS